MASGVHIVRLVSMLLLMTSPLSGNELTTQLTKFATLLAETQANARAKIAHLENQLGELSAMKTPDQAALLVNIDERIKNELSDIGQKMETALKSVRTIGYQLMMTQFGQEEYRRHSGGSGVQQVRLVSSGTRPYHEDSYTGRRMAAMHDHSDHERIVGLGEFSAVLNGVHFQTRHNDFPLRSVDPDNETFGATKEVEYPPLPPKVASAIGVKNQIVAMRDCFKQWVSDNFTDPQCDIRNTFVPVLCYMEGYWTVKKEFVEPFESERHSVDASSWEDLHQKAMFVAGTGRKETAENFAFLPTKIINITDDGQPVTAQWTYRILTEPMTKPNIRAALKLSRFRMVDDLQRRTAANRSYKKMALERGSRFQLMPNATGWYNWNSGDAPCDWEREFTLFTKDEEVRQTIMDKMMDQIPGLNHNKPYSKELIDDAFGNSIYRMDKMPPHDPDAPTPAVYKAGHYHRYYKEFALGAMGNMLRKRGFADSGVFMAANTRPEVAPNNMHLCRAGVCTDYQQRWSYAIPLEIIWLTPLQTWNPYGIKYKGLSQSEEGKTVTQDRDDSGKIVNTRRGGMSELKALNGANSKHFYITPEGFYTNPEDATVEEDSADTDVAGIKGVIGRNGKVYETVASGIRIVTPAIGPVIGKVRIRYPIAPIYSSGSSVSKEVDAVKDVLTKHQQYRRIFRDDPLNQPPCCIAKDDRVCKHKCTKEEQCRLHEYAPKEDWDPTFRKIEIQEI